MLISAALKPIKRLYIETAPFIYFIENRPMYAEKMESIFKVIYGQSISVSSSSITITETLVKPIQAKDELLKQHYLDFLNTRPITLYSVQAQIAQIAAEVRASTTCEHQMRCMLLVFVA